MSVFSPTTQQASAIDYPKSMVITACPGSGKTTVIKEKIRNITDKNKIIFLLIIQLITIFFKTRNVLSDIFCQLKLLKRILLRHFHHIYSPILKR